MEYSIKSQFENAEKYVKYFCKKILNKRTLPNSDKSKSLTELAPTSSSIEGHLSRCYYVVYNSINLLKVSESLDPVIYEWTSTHNGFLPEKREKEMSAVHTVTCNCKIRCTAKCKCMKNDEFSTFFCKCRNQKSNNN